jgi:hypothetical protein
MPLAEIGRWEFFIPDEWHSKDPEPTVSYFESPDGCMGLYAKSIRPKQPESTPLDLAEDVQNSHFSGYNSDDEVEWRIMERTFVSEGDNVLSALDLWDQARSYRVLSLVLATASDAVQVTLHDYDCVEHGAENLSFARVRDSLKLVAGAA